MPRATKTRSHLRKIALGTLLAPLALGLAACGDKAADGGEVPTSEPIAKIAPPAGQSWADVIEKTPEGGYRMGNPEAPIKLVEYGALSCSHCAEFAHESFEPLRNDYVASGRVSYELRYFMLNAYDFPATMLATCGSTEAVLPLSEQFWAWQPNMFQNAQAAGDDKLEAIGKLPREKQFAATAEVAGMTEFFASRGLPRDKALACLDNAATAKTLADQTQKATQEYEISGTPSFILNGVRLNSLGWKELEAKLQQAGAR